MRRSDSSHTRIVKLAALILLLGIIVAAAYHINRDKPAPTATSSTRKISHMPPVAAATSHADTKLQQVVDTWAASQSFHTSVVVSELTGSLRTASRNTDVSMVTASTYKIFVAYATLHEVEQGKLSLGQVTSSGQTVEAALDKMILQSDNASAETLGFLVGWDTVDSLAAQVGATHTDINNYVGTSGAKSGDKHSTAADLATMVTKLYQGTLLDKTDSKLLLGLMEKQVWRERIPAGLPSGVVVADKPGWLDDVENDAAIVYGPKSTYVLVVMTDGSTTQPLADLSHQVYSYLET